MKIKVVKNDITKVGADIVVNTANPFPIIGAGTDSAIYKAAGEKELLHARIHEIGNMQPGDARITAGFNLCNYIIHAVGPRYVDGNHNEEKILRRCYRNALKLAKKYNGKLVAFPLISAGTYGFPLEDAISIAVSEMNDFNIKNVSDMEVVIAVLSETSFFLLNKVIDETEVVITSEEIKKKYEEEYGPYHRLYREARHKDNIKKKKASDKDEYFVLSEDDKSFAEMISYYLNIRNEKRIDVYERVKIDKRQFSKYINGEREPSRKDAIKLCIGLRLTLPQSYDLLSRAGYNFNPSDPVDHIVAGGIREGKSYSEICSDILNRGFKSKLTG